MAGEGIEVVYHSTPSSAALLLHIFRFLRQDAGFDVETAAKTCVHDYLERARAAYDSSNSSQKQQPQQPTGQGRPMQSNNQRSQAGE